jgi:serine/threonine-protein kinase HipA
MGSIEELFRRMVFNIIARNQDDHVKNIAFLMDKTGRWFLAPAFDITYSYNPGGSWTATHQMTMNGKRDRFTLTDFRACAQSVLMKRGRADAIIEQVRSAVRQWPDFAEQAAVPETWQIKIRKTHNFLEKTPWKISKSLANFTWVKGKILCPDGSKKT